jgi:hypothetical protein
MDAVEDYARRWIKREVDQDPELESLSDWVRTIRSLVQGTVDRIFVRRIDNSFVEQVDDPAMYLCFYGVLWREAWRLKI